MEISKDDRTAGPKIVVLGGINMDLIGVTPRLPAQGETVIGERFYTTPGGKGANQAVAAAKLGASVKMVGRVGADAFGPAMLDDLRRHGIDVGDVAVDPLNASGIAIILLDADRQNHIVAIYGANTACDGAQLEAVKAALHGADALMLQLEIPAGLSLAAAEHAQALGVHVVWDPAPALDLPERALALAEVLTPNQTEAAFFTGIEVADASSAKAAAEALLSQGVKVATVKMGEQGVYYASRAESGHVPAFGVEVTDTVAAGDAFGAGLCVALAEGKSLAESVRFGAAAGALAVTRPGAQEAMPARHEVEELLDSS